MKKITEENLLFSLKELESQQEEINNKLSKMRKSVLDAESDLIEIKIKSSRLREQLEEYRLRTPDYTPDLREIEIEGFRERNPDVVEFAIQRDKIIKE